MWFCLLSRQNSSMSNQQINQRPSSMVSETSTAVTTSAVDAKPGSKVKEKAIFFQLVDHSFTDFKSSVLMLISVGLWI